MTPQYYAELLTWAAIGACTVESPLHRQMASALSASVGFKNAIRGGWGTALDAMHVAAQSHRFPTISIEGRAMVITTTSNPDGHLILRGTSGGPHYDVDHVGRAVQSLQQSGLAPRLVIDCSHGICGVMLERHLVAGRQDIVDGLAGLSYGLSITDGCIGWDETVDVVGELVQAVTARRQR